MLATLFLHSCGIREKPEINPSAKQFYDEHMELIGDTIQKRIFWIEKSNSSFCKTKLLGGNEQELFLYAMCKEYLSNGEIGGGVWIPVKIPYPEFNSSAVEFPRDGSYYTKDLNRIFPSQVVSYYLNDQSQIKKIMSDLKE